MNKKITILSIVISLVLLMILVPSVEAKKKKKDKKKDKKEKVEEIIIQPEVFEFSLNLVHGERSRDSHREYIIIDIKDGKVTYHSEFQGRPRKDVPENFDASYMLTEPLKHGLLAQLQKNNLLKNLTEEKSLEGIGNYIRFTLKIQNQGQQYDSKIVGMFNTSQKDNQISESAQKFQEGVLTVAEFLRKQSPAQP